MPETQQPTVIIYTDGACVPNPGPGGWAAILLSDELDKVREICGSVSYANNMRMELLAAVEALGALKRPCKVTLFTDSKYLSRGITEWLPRWKKNHWKLQNGSYVKNQDLWKNLDQLTSIHQVEWRWIKAHAKNEMNERVDQLAHAQVNLTQLPPHEAPGNHLYVRAVANKQFGAWVCIVRNEQGVVELSGIMQQATVNQMEIQAIIEGLRFCPTDAKVFVYTHNNYIYSALIRDLELWESRSWQTTSGHPIKNLELWRQLLDAKVDRAINWHLVKQKTLIESEHALSLARKLIKEKSN